MSDPKRTNGRPAAASRPGADDMVSFALELIGRTVVEPTLATALRLLSRGRPQAGWAILRRVESGRFTATVRGGVGRGDLRRALRLATGSTADLTFGAGTPHGRLRGKPHWGAVDDRHGPSVVLVCWPGRGAEDAELAEVLSVGVRIIASALDCAVRFESLQERSYRDPLTELLNRRGILDVLRQERARTLRHGRPLSVLFLDLDRFKEINDLFGHRVGDELLCGTARGLESALRRCDTVGRIGGDEFLIVLPDTGVAAARRIGTRLSRELRDVRVPTSAGPIPVWISAGAAAAGDESETGLIERADRRMLATKRRRRAESAVGFAEVAAGHV